jgi:hypothetical protein
MGQQEILQIVVDLLKANGFHADVRAGLSQGASTSPILADWIIATALKDFLTKAVIIYADDILVMGTTKQEVLELANALRARLSAHPSGPYQLNMVVVSDIKKEIDFLGYRVSIKNGKPHFAPRARRRNKFDEEQDRLIKAVSTSKGKAAKRMAAEHARMHLRAWMAGFALWEEEEAYKFKKTERARIDKAQAK